MKWETTETFNKSQNHVLIGEFHVITIRNSKNLYRINTQVKEVKHKDAAKPTLEKAMEKAEHIMQQLEGK